MNISASLDRQIIVSHPAKQGIAYQVAYASQHHQTAVTFLTGMYYKPERFPYRHVSLLPQTLRARVVGLLEKRRMRELDPRFVASVSGWLPEFANRVLRRPHWGEAVHDRLAARWIRRHVRGRTPTVVHGFIGSCARTFQAARDVGAVIEMTSPPWKGEIFGCGWGRWCLAAARLGYRPVGVDPNLDLVRAAGRVAAQFGVEASFLVGDARHLPFRSGSVDVVHSYAMLQHLARDDVRLVLADAGRVLAPGARADLQFASRMGPRNVINQLRRGFREPKNSSSFQMRYWSQPDVLSALAQAIGPAQIEVDGYFFTSAGAGGDPQLPLRYRALLGLSRRLRRLSAHFPPLRWCADSIYGRARVRTHNH